MTSLLLDVMTTAGILFVVALGLLIVYGVLKIINFAHGGFLTIGGYAALVVTSLGWSPWLAPLLALSTGLVLGAAVERVVVRPLYNRPLDAILATWGLSIVLVQLITVAFGRGVQFVQSPVSGAVPLLDTSYSLYRLLMLGVAAVLGVAVAAVLQGTRLGLAARAVIMNENLARGLGINSDLVRFVTFTAGAGLAALAGCLLTPLLSVDPLMGLPWLLNAFMLVMVSGTSLLALATASLVLGGAQVVVSTYTNPVLGGLTIVVLAALLLRIRPAGFARG
ncbi:branched-chain amino acid ABC transporter permease [Paracraurococcus lichenis]|uniref:Branched-chain amino acid ABC transporter permease n=1 Tax=Paracraurococcus lichenis TaxID=3064888 RepID=A0ABT9E3L9_9PROT|nr:branched-chain amino acid ABC transporter permease [Paracraurococcus sp. LOR1-02]MDO9710764.1 branched-chain amino acid ABC transporter permease [Paracraurococcus sp. LOR1-02]